ncbi:hypothetical protein LSH36_161g00046 [Paralvinella palmiformis]|uniref:Uncharacterized protein n=1 Tax=Paralvinella palmiformis TaxID=53620 RepID=A0AAD9JT58_9ANNE|nr:hypothetical protein LSH36_161g00046 [Paralvinella palmiformis]
MSKCEGLCTSRVSPSVLAYPGFKKDCKCCRESRLEDRAVTLTECYDGRSLVPGQFVRMRIREPVSCQCYDCAI